MARRIAFALLFAALAAHFICTLARAPEAICNALYAGIEAGACALILARAIAVPRNRAAWALIGIGIGCWIGGDTAWMLHARTLSGAFYTGLFLLIYCALALLLRDRIRPFPTWLTIDGLLAGLALTALASTAFGSIHSTSVAFSLGNLVCALLLLVIVLVGFAATSWRPGGSWWYLGAGLIACGLAEGLFTVQGNSYTPGTWLDSLWCAAMTLTAVAAWQRTSRPTRAHVGWAMAAIPLGGSALAIATMVLAGLTHAQPLTFILAAAALTAALARAMLMLGENFRLLATARAEALTDKLTELPNRRALVHDLEEAAAHAPHTLVFFDLDGFKDYNDAFGHPAGDALRRRVAPQRAAVGPSYRLGGDEFCLLLEAALSDDHATIADAVQALSEHGDGFSISASHGLVVLPEDA